MVLPKLEKMNGEIQSRKRSGRECLSPQRATFRADHSPLSSEETPSPAPAFSPFLSPDFCGGSRSCAFNISCPGWSCRPGPGWAAVSWMVMHLWSAEGRGLAAPGGHSWAGPALPLGTHIPPGRAHMAAAGIWEGGREHSFKPLIISGLLPFELAKASLLAQPRGGIGSTFPQVWLERRVKCRNC